MQRATDVWKSKSRCFVVLAKATEVLTCKDCLGSIVLDIIMSKNAHNNYSMHHDFDTCKCHEVSPCSPPQV